jgi:hypothetical protein
VQDHDVLVANARYCREKSGLIYIHKHEGFNLVFRDENVALFLVGNILAGTSLVGSATLIERTPWRWPCMCPF